MDDGDHPYHSWVMAEATRPSRKDGHHASSTYHKVPANQQSTPAGGPIKVILLCFTSLRKDIKNIQRCGGVFIFFGGEGGGTKHLLAPEAPPLKTPLVLQLLYAFLPA